MDAIKPSELKTIAEYIEDVTGIVLDQSKGYLVEGRLGPLAKELGCQNYQEFYLKMKSSVNNGITKRFIDAITTNETFFYRDKSPFDLLKFKLIPDLFDRLESSGSLPDRSIKIWSSACSNGQEVYSIAIILKELLGNLFKYRIKLLGTDLSDAAIAKASYGKYNQTEIERGLAPEKRVKYFSKVGDSWRINDELRSIVTFKRMNLLEPFTGLDKFDIIFCRNVAIYFSKEHRKILFERIAEKLKPDGVLIIGSTESLLGITDRFQRKQFRNSVYFQLK